MSSNYYNSNSNGGAVNLSDFERSPVLFLTNKGIDFMKRHYVMSMLYICGMLLVAFAKGFIVDNITQKEYRKALYSADEIADTTLYNAQKELQATYHRYYLSKGWFSCDLYCQENYQSYLNSQAHFNTRKSEYEAAVSEANKIVGVFSEYGVANARKMFWDCWQWGKDFAKRISYYDAIFLMFDSRDESAWAWIARFIIRILINFTIGFISALISFVWQLWWFVRSYGGGIAGILFFLLGALAAWSLIVSAIIGMYAATAATVGGVMMMAQNRGAVGAGRSNRRRHLHFQ